MELFIGLALLWFVWIILPAWLTAHYASKGSLEFAPASDEEPRRDPYWRMRALLKTRKRR